ncbi:MAG TPA: hypothetical protein VLE44_01530 [Candidatus Saccharimonadales bacterium]|nr:hypothetical protein [Candidatus Saccharimonadales bacterium]
MAKQTAPIIKAKFGKQLGFRTPSTFKGKTFSGKSTAGFDPSRFKTQHKG